MLISIFNSSSRRSLVEPLSYNYTEYTTSFYRSQCRPPPCDHPQSHCYSVCPFLSSRLSPVCQPKKNTIPSSQRRYYNTILYCPYSISISTITCTPRRSYIINPCPATAGSSHATPTCITSQPLFQILTYVRSTCIHTNPPSTPVRLIHSIPPQHPNKLTHMPVKLRLSPPFLP